MAVRECTKKIFCFDRIRNCGNFIKAKEQITAFEIWISQHRDKFFSCFKLISKWLCFSVCPYIFWFKLNFAIKNQPCIYHHFVSLSSVIHIALVLCVYCLVLFGTGSATLQTCPSPCGSVLPHQHFLWGWHSHVHTVGWSARLHGHVMELWLLRGHLVCPNQFDWTAGGLRHGAQSTESALCLWSPLLHHRFSGLLILLPGGLILLHSLFTVLIVTLSRVGVEFRKKVITWAKIFTSRTFFFFCVPSYVSGVHHFGWDFCVCDHILSSWISPGEWHWRRQILDFWEDGLWKRLLVSLPSLSPLLASLLLLLLRSQLYLCGSPFWVKFLCMWPFF